MEFIELHEIEQHRIKRNLTFKQKFSKTAFNIMDKLMRTK